MNKEIEKKLKRSMNVGDLKNIIKNLPDNMPLGVIGHFGEVHLLNKGDIKSTSPKLDCYITPGSWRSEIRENIQILNINAPDIGPEPD